MEAVKLSLYEKDMETGILENLLGTYLIEVFRKESRKRREYLSTSKKACFFI